MWNVFLLRTPTIANIVISAIRVHIVLIHHIYKRVIIATIVIIVSEVKNYDSANI